MSTRSSLFNEGGGTRLVHEGDVVTKGTVMVRLRDADYKIKVDQATSQLDQARAGLVQTEEGVKQAQVGVDKATLDYGRADALFKKQSLTKIRHGRCQSSTGQRPGGDRRRQGAIAAGQGQNRGSARAGGRGKSGVERFDSYRAVRLRSD